MPWLHDSGRFVHWIFRVSSVLQLDVGLLRRHSEDWRSEEVGGDVGMKNSGRRGVVYSGRGERETNQGSASPGRQGHVPRYVPSFRLRVHGEAYLSTTA